MEFTLRQARASDLADIMALERKGFVAGIVEEASVFERRLEVFPEGFVVAQQAGERCWGYLCAELWSSWSNTETERFVLGHDLGDWLDRRGTTLYVASMTVDPAFRGEGRGRLLFQKALAHFALSFPWVRELVLIVNEHWAAARAIYRSEGFDEVGRLVEFFHPDGGPKGDAVIMKKETQR